MTKRYININSCNLTDLYPSTYRKKSKSKSKFKSSVIKSTQDLSLFVWEIQESDTGAKNAFLQLKERMRNPEVTKDVEDLIDRKAYTILTPQMQGSLDNALETFKVSDLSRVPRRNMYCLLLEPTVYVFFWHKTSK